MTAGAHQVAGTRGAVLLLVLEVKDRREVAPGFLRYRRAMYPSKLRLPAARRCPATPPFHVLLPPPRTCRQILTYYMV